MKYAWNIIIDVHSSAKCLVDQGCWLWLVFCGSVEIVHQINTRPVGKLLLTCIEINDELLQGLAVMIYSAVGWEVHPVLVHLIKLGSQIGKLFEMERSLPSKRDSLSFLVVVKLLRMQANSTSSRSIIDDIDLSQTQKIEQEVSSCPWRTCWCSDLLVFVADEAFSFLKVSLFPLICLVSMCVVCPTFTFSEKVFIFSSCCTLVSVWSC